MTKAESSSVASPPGTADVLQVCVHMPRQQTYRSPDLWWLMLPELGIKFRGHDLTLLLRSQPQAARSSVQPPGRSWSDPGREGWPQGKRRGLQLRGRFIRVQILSRLRPSPAALRRSPGKTQVFQYEKSKVCDLILCPQVVRRDLSITLSISCNPASGLQFAVCKWLTGWSPYLILALWAVQGSFTHSFRKYTLDGTPGWHSC